MLPDVISAVEYAAAWLTANGVDLPRGLRYDMAAIKFRIGMDLDEIQSEYNERMYNVMDDFMRTERPITSFRNAFRRVINDGFNLAAATGWIDAGGSGPMPEKLQDWINNRITTEIVYADELWRELKRIRSSMTPDEQTDFIQRRADGYSGAVEGVYLQGKAIGYTDRPGKWIYGDTVEHCDTCAELSNNTRPLSWYVENGYIPRQAGSQTLDCHGYHCDCRVIDPETGEQLL